MPTSILSNRAERYRNPYVDYTQYKWYFKCSCGAEYWAKRMSRRRKYLACGVCETDIKWVENNNNVISAFVQNNKE